MDSKQWINDIRELNIENDNIFLLKNSRWQIKNKLDILLKNALKFYDHHLEIIKNIALEVLSEIHPMFDIKSENRFAYSVYNKVPKYSNLLKKGIIETLIFLNIHSKELINCTLHKSEETVSTIIRELLSNNDWRLWASLNDFLPILAEADPNEFLLSVNNALKQTPCPFDALYNEENEGGIMGANYITGLYWALENLAWSEEYLTRTILVLAGLANRDPGGRWSNRPDNSIITILLPWYPQTMASVENRVASIRGIQINYPNTAWKILVNLLPKMHQTTSGSHKPKFRKYIPADWKNGVSNNDYWKQIQEYASMTVNMAKKDSKYVFELVDNLNNIPQPSFNDFIKYLSSDIINDFDEEQRLLIWEKLISLAHKHRNFSDADWAFSIKIVELIEETAKKIIPIKPEYLYRNLFNDNSFEFMDRDEKWEVFNARILKQRIEALKKICGNNNIESIVNFSRNVKNPMLVGDAYTYIVSIEEDIKLFPSLLDNPEQYVKQFISGFVWVRYKEKGIQWIDSLEIGRWTCEQKCIFFQYLPFEDEIWKKADEYLKKDIVCYWKKVNVNPYTKNNIIYAIDNLLKYNRPRSALSCIYGYYYSTKELFREQAIKALINGISTDEPADTMGSHYIIEIIRVLQEDPNLNENDLFKIEWGYLQLFDNSYGAEPKLLEKYLSKKSDFFIEIIKLLYRSKNDKKLEKKIKRSKQNLFFNAWKLLHNWKRPPGKMDDGSFSGEVLEEWVTEVKIKTIESGHFEMAMNHLGHVLYYVGSDPNGLWINQSVAEIIEIKDNDDIRRGFYFEIINSRGAHFVDKTGKAEYEIADSWRRKTEEVEKLGFINFATTLKSVVTYYEHEAERVISRFDNSENIDGVNQ